MDRDRSMQKWAKRLRMQTFEYVPQASIRLRLGSMLTAQATHAWDSLLSGSQNSYQEFPNK